MPYSGILNLYFYPETLKFRVWKQNLVYRRLIRQCSFSVTGKILIRIENHNDIVSCVEQYKSYIASQVLADNIELIDKNKLINTHKLEINKNIKNIA